MAVFSVLKNYNVFIDGYSQAGKCDVTMPDLQIRTTEHTAGGIDGAINVDLGIQALTLTVTIREYDPNILGLFGLGDSSNKSFTFRGAQENNQGVVSPVVCEIRGWVNGVNHGSWTGGSITTIDISINAKYLRLEVAGQTIYEIDPINMVRTINGVDALAQQRQALGL